MSPASYRTAPPRVECAPTLGRLHATSKSARARVQAVDERTQLGQAIGQAGPAQPDPEVVARRLEHAGRYQQDASLGHQPLAELVGRQVKQELGEADAAGPGAYPAQQ